MCRLRYADLVILPRAAYHSYMPKLNRIRVILAERDKTAAWLAREMGRNKSTVSRWCSNSMQPSLETLYEVAGALRVDVRELLWPNEINGENEME